MNEEINSKIILKKNTALLTIKGFKFNNSGLKKKKKPFLIFWYIMRLMHYTEKNAKGATS